MVRWWKACKVPKKIAREGLKKKVIFKKRHGYLQATIMSHLKLTLLSYLKPLNSSYSPPKPPPIQLCSSFRSNIATSQTKSYLKPSLKISFPISCVRCTSRNTCILTTTQLLLTQQSKILQRVWVLRQWLGNIIDNNVNRIVWCVALIYW